MLALSLHWVMGTSVYLLIDWLTDSFIHSFIRSFIDESSRRLYLPMIIIFLRYECDDHDVISNIDLLQCNPGMDAFKTDIPWVCCSTCLEHRQVLLAERSKYDQRKHGLSQQGVLRVRRQIFLRIFTYNCIWSIWIKFYFLSLFIFTFLVFLHRFY